MYLSYYFTYIHMHRHYFTRFFSVFLQRQASNCLTRVLVRPNKRCLSQGRTGGASLSQFHYILKCWLKSHKSLSNKNLDLTFDVHNTNEEVLASWLVLKRTNILIPYSFQFKYDDFVGIWNTLIIFFFLIPKNKNTK